jgi:hypothetical protein
MATDLSQTEATSNANSYSWLRDLAAALCAAVISAGISFLGRRAGWSYSRPIAFATFLFLIPVLRPLFQGQRGQSWNSRLSLGVLFGLIGALFYAVVLNR